MVTVERSLFFGMQLLGVELEKVVGEQLRYTCESNGVDVGAVEYFVYVGAAA